MPNPFELSEKEPMKSAFFTTITIHGRPLYSVERLNEKTTLVKFRTEDYSTIIFAIEDEDNENMAAVFEAVARYLRMNYGIPDPRKGR